MRESDGRSAINRTAGAIGAKPTGGLHSLIHQAISASFENASVERFEGGLAKATEGMQFQAAWRMTEPAASSLHGLWS
jgi:hypothetical protein